MWHVGTLTKGEQCVDTKCSARVIISINLTHSCTIKIQLTILVQQPLDFFLFKNVSYKKKKKMKLCLKSCKKT